MTAIPSQDLEDAEVAYNRVKAEIDALSLDELAPPNVDIVGATSIALGVAERIVSHRDRLAKLPEFEVRYVDNLVDYAKATWYAHITNLPTAEPTDAADLIAEVTELRSKLLMWAVPLVGAGKFEEAAIAKIREGSGYKDTSSDVVALVNLYRSKWDEVKNICGVTEQDLARGAEIGPAVFTLISRREYKLAASASGGSLRVRRAWTLLDRAYNQCRRGLRFIRFDEDDTDLLAPSLRRNAGNRSPSDPKQEPAPAHTNDAPVAPAHAAVAETATGGFGGGGAPFMTKPDA